MLKDTASIFHVKRYWQETPGQLFLVQGARQIEIKWKCDQTNCQSRKPLKNKERTAKVLFVFLSFLNQTFVS